MLYRVALGQVKEYVWEHCRQGDTDCARLPAHVVSVYAAYVGVLIAHVSMYTSYLGVYTAHVVSVYTVNVSVHFAHVRLANQ